MKTATKKLFGILLVVTVLICTVAVTALTPETFSPDGDPLTYTVLTESTVSVSDCDPGRSSITIPAAVEWEGVIYTVTKLDGVLSDGDDTLETIIFEDGCQIEVIWNSFNGCTKLKSLTIPKSVEVIGKKSFGNCINLASLTFESGSQLKEIGNKAFAYTGKDAKTVPAAIQNLTFPASLETLAESAFRAIPVEHFALEDGSKLTEIPKGFLAADGLDGKPGTYTTLETLLAFLPPEQVAEACACLKSIDFGDNNSLVWIGNGAFKNQIHLTDIDFGKGSAAKLIISEGAFVAAGNNGSVAKEKLAGIDMLEFPANLVEMGGSAFTAARIKNIVFPENCALAEIGNGFMEIRCDTGRPGYAYNSNTSSYEFENDPVQIGANSLETVDFGMNNSLTTIGNGAFRNQSHMTAIEFGTSNKKLTIKAGAFCGVGNNAYLVEQGVDSALNKGIETLVFPANLVKIGSYETNYYGTEVFVSGVFSYARIKKVVFSDGCQLAEIPDGFMKTDGSGSHNGYPSLDKAAIAANCLETIDFGENNSLTTIGAGAFSNQSHLTNIDFGTAKDGVTLSISSAAFVGVGNNGWLVEKGIDSVLHDGIETLVFPANLTSLGNSAFELSHIKNIKFSDNSQLTEIPSMFIGIIGTGNNGYPGQSSQDIFYKDLVQLSANSLESIKFGKNNSLTTIGSAAFYNQSHLKEIDFGTSSAVLRIENGAFIGAGNNGWLVDKNGETLNEGIETLVFPANLTYIGTGAFELARIENIKFSENCQLKEIPQMFMGITRTGNNGHPGQEWSEDQKAHVFVKDSAQIAANNLKTIDFGKNNSLQMISRGAFYNQNHLTSIDFGTAKNGVELTIDFAAFIGAGNNAYLVEQGIDDTLNEGIETLVFPSNLVSLGNGSGGAFEVARIKNIVFSDGCEVAKIPEGFMEIRGADGVATTDPVYVAANCLETVDFGENNNLTTFGNGAFRYQTNLTSIDFGGNTALTSLGYGVLAGTASLKSLDLSGTKIASIDHGAFIDSGLTEILLPDTLTTLTHGVFQGLDTLETLTIGSDWKITKLEGGVFSNCGNLTVVNLLNSNITVIDDSLKKNEKLTSIIFPVTLKSIVWTDAEDKEKCPFYDCENVNKLHFASADPGDYNFTDGVFQFLNESGIVYVPSETTDVNIEAYKTKLTRCGLSFAEGKWKIERQINVTGVELDKNEVAMRIGESVTLTATVLPENASVQSVTWSSNNPDVATVDGNGKVTVVGAGTAIVTVTTNDGNMTASCIVTGGGFCTITFKDGNTVIATITQAYGSMINNVPTAPTKEGYTFVGWDKDIPSTMPAEDMVLNARWTKDDVPVYSISGNIVGAASNDEITLTLMKGDNSIVSTTVVIPENASIAPYSFQNVEAGVYNIVSVNQNGVTMTIMVVITDSNMDKQDIVLPSGNVNSILKVLADEGKNKPGVVVDGLHTEAAVVKENDGAQNVNVTVTMTVTAEKAEESDEDQAAITSAVKDLFKDAEIEFFDIIVEKTVGSAVSQISETNTVMQIVFPFDFTGKADVMVFHKHSNNDVEALEELTAKPDSPANGQFYADRENGLIYIYTNKFSTYAIVSNNAADEEDASEENKNNYFGNHGVLPSIHDVKVEETENGTIRTSSAVAANYATVKFSVTPDEGYELAYVEVLCSKGKIAVVLKNSWYQFVMPSEDVTISAVFQKIETSDEPVEG